MNMTVTQLRPRDQAVADRSKADIAVDTSRQVIDANTFRHAMRNLGAGVSIVTSGKGADRRGLTVTAACSLSAEPPSILVCVNRNAEAYATITESRSFAVNFLAFDQLDIALRFAGHNGWRGESRFGLGTWTSLTTGSPILVKSLCSVDCELSSVTEHGSHSIITGLIVDTVRRVEGEPLLYFKGQFSRIMTLDLLEDFVESGFEA